LIVDVFFNFAEIHNRIDIDKNSKKLVLVKSVKHIGYISIKDFKLLGGIHVILDILVFGDFSESLELIRSGPPGCAEKAILKVGCTKAGDTVNTENRNNNKKIYSLHDRPPGMALNRKSNRIQFRTPGKK
jgi:hypothetical protein